MRALSGVIDLYFFSGPDPKDVIQQYVSEIGLPAMQPYWHWVTINVDGVTTLLNP